MVHAELSQGPAGEAALESPRRSLASALERWLGTLVEVPAALLVVAEIVILFAGVVARYGLHRPLIWSDELASILFLWLAALGAVVAFRRGEHMRMTAIVGVASPRVRAFLDAVAIAAALAFLLLVVEPAYEYASDEALVATPALELSGAWRAAALPGRAGADGRDGGAAARQGRPLAARRRRRGHGRRAGRRAVGRPALVRGPRQPQPADLLRRR